jgi:16S rRNA (uracil1498-N3)-methyltransferase
MGSAQRGNWAARPRRFFFEGELRPGEQILTGQTARHIGGVLRLTRGDRIVLFDGSGREFPAEITSVSRQGVRAVLADGVPVDRESPLSLRLGVGLSQPRAMDLVVEKATELGVAEIVPMATQRSQGWLGGKRGKDRRERWERIAREAARQCGRNRFPRVRFVAEFSQVVDQEAPGALRLIFWEQETQGGLKDALTAHPRMTEIQALIGPEGGFSSAEVALALAAGFHIASLGPRILRTETAAIAVASLLQYEMGDLGVAG